MAPGLAAQHFHLADSGNAEHLAAAVREVVAPHVYVIGGECERLYTPVAGLAGRRLEVVQNYAKPLLDGVRQLANIHRVGPFAYEIRHRCYVVDCRQLLVKVLLKGVGVVQTLDESVDDAGLLVREINQTVEVARTAAGRHQLIHPAPHLPHGESGLAEGVEITVDAPVAGVQLLRQLIHRIAGVAGEKLHQPQQPFDLRLLHGYSLHQRSSQSKKLRCQKRAFCGCSTQWVSSGKMMSLLGTPIICAALKAAMPCS